MTTVARVKKFNSGPGEHGFCFLGGASSCAIRVVDTILAVRTGAQIKNILGKVVEELVDHVLLYDGDEFIERIVDIFFFLQPQETLDVRLQVDGDCRSGRVCRGW